MSTLIDVNMSGTPLKISCLPQHEWFWTAINRGFWEGNTLMALAGRVTPQTLYIDVGTWIGPTLMFAGSRAKRAIGVEPDAVAMAAAMTNLSLNPHIAQKVSLHSHALGAQGGVLELWSEEFGNSETTAVKGRGANKMTFMAMGIDEFLDSVLGDEPHVFIKVDIECGEYSFVPALCDSLKRRNVKADLYVSFHASLMVDEKRTMKSWAANLARNGMLLETLSDYGRIHTFNGEWVEASHNPREASEFAAWMDTGGTDASFLVVPR